MNGVIKFLATRNGRIVRVVAGLVLVVVGFFIPNNTVGWIVMIVGLVPLLAGIFDVCVFAPLFKLPFKGADIRAK